jgi:hypothetical protein
MLQRLECAVHSSTDMADPFFFAEETLNTFPQPEKRADITFQ